MLAAFVIAVESREACMSKTMVAIVSMVAYSRASLAARFLSSSLYLVAALEWYFVLGSLLARAALPPLARKNLVADSLPPTFMIRS